MFCFEFFFLLTFLFLPNNVIFFFTFSFVELICSDIVQQVRIESSKKSCCLKYPSYFIYYICMVDGMDKMQKQLKDSWKKVGHKNEMNMEMYYY